jgi:integrase
VAGDAPPGRGEEPRPDQTRHLPGPVGGGRQEQGAGAYGRPPPTKAVLFKDKIESFLEYGRTRTGAPLRPSTRRAYQTVLHNAARPLHNIPIAEIRRRHIASLLAEVASGTGPSMAALVRGTLGRYWTWLMSTDDEINSPVIGTPVYAIPKRLRPLSDAELRALWAETEQLTSFNAIIRLCLWTGCRRAEAGGARWSERSGDVWCIPGERTKNHRPVALPLAHQTLACWARLPRIVGGDLVFGAYSENGHSDWHGAKQRLDRRLRFNKPWVLHNLRATVETRMAGLGIPKEHVNKVLNHAAGAVAGRYDGHDYMAEKAAALQAWADQLERVVG